MTNTTTKPPDEDNTSIDNWKLIQEAIARRALTGEDMVELEDVSPQPDGSVVVSGKNAQGATVEHKAEPNATLERIAAEATETNRQLREMYEQAKQQAHVWFTTSVSAAVIGLLLALAGIVAVLFFQRNTVAVLSATVGGVLIEIVAQLFFKQYAEANRRIDVYRVHIGVFQQLVVIVVALLHAKGVSDFI